MFEWPNYRKQVLEPEGWRYGGPGVYVFELEDGSECEFHPFAPWVVDGRAVERWRVLAEAGKGPDPSVSHLDRKPPNVV